MKRDELFFHRGQIKKREDTLKRDSKEIKDELDSSKAIMEQKKAERAKISHEFWTKDNEHKAYIHERREEQKAKWREMKQKENREKQREL